MNETASCDDAVFGPVVHGCRQDFDFTRTFEQYIFTLVPSLVFLIVAPFRIASLRKISTRVEGQPLRIAKLIAIAIFSCLQLTLLILSATQPVVQGSRAAGLAASALSLAAALALLPLSYIEHARSLRPSLVASGYLAVSVLLDAATLRTLWISAANDSNNSVIRNIYTASWALKVLVLILEAVSKRRFFLSAYRGRSPEESSGLFGQGLLLWLNDIVFYGARHLLKPESLYPITEDMFSEKLGSEFWDLWTTGNPLMIQRLLAYLEDPVQRQDPKIGYALIGATVVVYIGMAISAAVYWHRHYRFMAMLRGTLITSVFRKATTISTTAATSAKTVTLLSADCERITRGLLVLHDLWADVAQVAIATYLIQTQLGVACVAPIAVTLVTTGLTVYFANLTPGYQLLWVEKLETRIGITSSVLGAMKAIKITNLTSKAGALLNKLREDELNSAKMFRIVNIVTATVATVPQLISPVVTFAVYIAVARRNEGSTLTATNMFTTLSLLLLIGEPLFSLFEGMISIMTAIGCLKRVEEFLHTPARKEQRSFLRDPDHAAALHTASAKSGDTGEDHLAREASTAIPDDVGIMIQGGNFGWDTETLRPLLKNIDLTVPAGQLTAVVGPVGCGKSTLVKAILGETAVWDGKMVLSDPDVAFCDQSPWIMNGTVRANVTYASAFDAELYASVLRCCDLVDDLATIAKGDMTVVGSKGSALSAGQRQRVALARAVYSRKKIALLDDVFSQLDASTQALIARSLLGPYGLFRRWGTTVLLSTSSSRFLALADQVIALDASGNVIQRGKLDDLVEVDGYIRDITRESTQSSSDGDTPIDVSASMPTGQEPLPNPETSKDIAASSPASDKAIYRYYLSSIKKIDLVSFTFFQTCVAFLGCFAYVWLKWWTEDSSTFPYGSSAYYLGIYAVIQTAVIIATGLSTLWCLNALAVTTGLQLHSTLTQTVMSATLQLFSTTDSGSIMNRFTQDIQLVDIQLPLSVLICVGHSLAVIGQAGLIASASGWIALSYPMLFAVFYYVPSYYVRTARQMRTLDLEEKAPIYAQFLESLEGMTTLRAFGWTHAAVSHNYTLVDRSQRPWYLMYVIQKWLGVVLDLVIAGLATLVVGLSVGLRNTDSGDAGFTGVSLTQIVSFTSYLKLLILFWAQLQMCMSAVQRIRSFSMDTETESDVQASDPSRAGGIEEPAADWPSEGGIVIRDLQAKYKTEDTELVLNNINLEIKPGEKICVCGRTGSGKSSLVLALFRLLDPTSGSIAIDGVSIIQVPRDTIRSRIVGVAEEPFFLPGSVRENMDPWGETAMDDARVIEALGDVGLWHGEGKLGNRDGGLDALLDPESLSMGQRQLFNIARAMLRESRVFVLDEVTSSLDVQAEQIVKQLIETRLASRTVIAVIHKLAFASGFDKVAVMHQGRIVEFDTPAVLMAREGSRFRELCEAQGITF
ncbi:ABC transporter [Microdochium bolleyi]|uniref:ABC transporter n=1 Tax=Microdochium bolleyi TaxID=196109 RepID=A0A136IQA1_9PEZI|nr:ABC transporter [Microdochium bolleyi]